MSTLASFIVLSAAGVETKMSHWFHDFLHVTKSADENVLCVGTQQRAWFLVDKAVEQLFTSVTNRGQKRDMRRLRPLPGEENGRWLI